MAKHMDYIEFYNFYYEHYIAFSRCESAKAFWCHEKVTYYPVAYVIFRIKMFIWKIRNR